MAFVDYVSKQIKHEYKASLTIILSFINNLALYSLQFQKITATGRGSKKKIFIATYGMKKIK